VREDRHGRPQRRACLPFSQRRTIGAAVGRSPLPFSSRVWPSHLRGNPDRARSPSCPRTAVQGVRAAWIVPRLRAVQLRRVVAVRGQPARRYWRTEGNMDAAHHHAAKSGSSAQRRLPVFVDGMRTPRGQCGAMEHEDVEQFLSRRASPGDREGPARGDLATVPGPLRAQRALHSSQADPGRRGRRAVHSRRIRRPGVVPACGNRPIARARRPRVAPR
jgi:hypothetical protein